jgi:pilus assembly protein Flp/PilA
LFIDCEVFIVLKRLKKRVQRTNRRLRGSVFVEYILLVTLVGIGIIAGLATVRNALVNELFDLANAINAINC